MRLLVLGAPRFLGRAIADVAIARGHELTFFNCRRTNPELYSEAERSSWATATVTSQRSAAGGWDAVIDNCGYVPHVVRASAEALAGSGRHLFVSGRAPRASGERDRDGDRGGVAPAERGRTHHAEHLADRTPRQTVQRCLNRAARE